jgi:hypothetical protein
MAQEDEQIDQPDIADLDKIKTEFRESLKLRISPRRKMRTMLGTSLPNGLTQQLPFIGEPQKPIQQKLDTTTETIGGQDIKIITMNEPSSISILNESPLMEETRKLGEWKNMGLRIKGACNLMSGTALEAIGGTVLDLAGIENKKGTNVYVVGKAIRSDDDTTYEIENDDSIRYAKLEAVNQNNPNFLTEKVPLITLEAAFCILAATLHGYEAPKVITLALHPDDHKNRVLQLTMSNVQGVVLSDFISNTLESDDGNELTNKLEIANRLAEQFGYWMPLQRLLGIRDNHEDNFIITPEGNMARIDAMEHSNTLPIDHPTDYLDLVGSDILSVAFRSYVRIINPRLVNQLSLNGKKENEAEIDGLFQEFLKHFAPGVENGLNNLINQSNLLETLLNSIKNKFPVIEDKINSVLEELPKALDRSLWSDHILPNEVENYYKFLKRR